MEKISLPPVIYIDVYTGALFRTTNILEAIEKAQDAEKHGLSPDIWLILDKAPGDPLIETSTDGRITRHNIATEEIYSHGRKINKVILGRS